jgi:hypothetical protein
MRDIEMHKTLDAKIRREERELRMTADPERE